MRIGRLLVINGVMASFAIAALISCLADPREDDTVVIAERCELSALTNASDPKSPQASLKAYVEATDKLLTQSVAAENALKDACNAIDTDLGLATNTTAQTACNPIIQRLQAIVKNEPVAPPGALAVNHFVDIVFPNTCVTPPGTLESCLATCTGPCDSKNVANCPADKLVGVCNGECLGSCTETGDAIPCTGKCIGETGLDGGSCAGECVGRCGAPAWTGNCSGACAAGFSGFCSGTCTGTCNGSPVGPQPVDAGGPPPNDAGGDPDAEAGGPPVIPGGPAPRPPTGQDGNCPGKCVGMCSSGAFGNCNGQCLTYADAGPPIGEFAAGFCGGGQVPAGCTGACRVGGIGGNGSTNLCTGTCQHQNPKRQCTGLCRVTAGGGCNGTLTNAFCESTPTCGQNVECANACQAIARLSSACAEPKVAQIILVTDKPFYDALVKNQAKLGKALSEITNLREAAGFIGNRTFGDFATLGLTNDVERACIAQGRANVEKAQTSIANAVAANPTTAQKIQ